MLAPQGRCALILMLLLADPLLARADPYTSAMERASALEQAGHLQQAAAALRRVADDYPQDYALQLRAGWLHFRAKEPRRALAFYRRALEITPTSVEARLGLAWALFRAGDRASAHQMFGQILRDSPDLASARQGHELSRPPPAVALAPAVFTTVQGYQGGSRSWGLGLALSLPLVIHGRGLLDLDYRLGHFVAPGGGNGNGSGKRSSSSFQQHEAYAAAGVATPRFGALGHYGLIHDGSGLAGTAHVAGLSARYSPWGDIVLESSATIYPGMRVYRTAPSWRIPVLRWLSLTPAVALQMVDRDTDAQDPAGEGGETLVSGLLTVSARWSRLGLWVGGKYGDEVRPTYLAAPLVLDLAERISFGVWGGCDLKLGRGFTLHLAYELNRLQGQSQSGSLHAVTLGLTWRGP